MATPIEFVEKQWVEWQENNPTHTHIDTEELTELLIKELNFYKNDQINHFTPL